MVQTTWLKETLGNGSDELCAEGASHFAYSCAIVCA